jgi:hypothetical protein
VGDFTGVERDCQHCERCEEAAGDKEKIETCARVLLHLLHPIVGDRDAISMSCGGKRAVSHGERRDERETGGKAVD